MNMACDVECSCTLDTATSIQAIYCDMVDMIELVIEMPCGGYYVMHPILNSYDFVPEGC